MSWAPLTPLPLPSESESSASSEQIPEWVTQVWAWLYQAPAAPFPYAEGFQEWLDDLQEWLPNPRAERDFCQFFHQPIQLVSETASTVTLPDEPVCMFEAEVNGETVFFELTDSNMIREMISGF